MVIRQSSNQAIRQSGISGLTILAPIRQPDTQTLRHSDTQTLRHSDTQTIGQSGNRAIGQSAIVGSTYLGDVRVRDHRLDPRAEPRDRAARLARGVVGEILRRQVRVEELDVLVVDLPY
eukprot:6493334-Prymnesium_polylepis.2